MLRAEEFPTRAARPRSGGRRWSLRAGCAALITLALWASPASASPERLAITGPKVILEATVRRAVGQPPKRTDLALWARRARERVRRLYRGRGYLQVRVWTHVDGDLVHVHVDEGRMESIVFVGLNVVNTVLYRVQLDLPHEVFHEPTLARFARRLRERYDLENVYWQVHEGRRSVVMPHGEKAPIRELVVYVVTRERYGWLFNLRLDAVHGVVPTVGIRAREAIAPHDRIEASVGIGIPFRRLFFDSDPKFRWVFGAIDFGYEVFPWGRLVAPRVDGRASLLRNTRLDLDIREYLHTDNSGFLSFILEPGRTRLGIGGGVDHARVFDIRRTEDMDPATVEEAPGTEGSLRWALRLTLELDLSPTVIRQDLRDFIHLRLTYGDAMRGGQDRLFDARAQGQSAIHLGPHDIISRARLLYMRGDVHFWDEEPLAGRFLRVFFGNRFHVREAAQVDLQARFAAFRTVKLGFFFDVSVFLDRRGGRDRAAHATAAGPSVHTVLWDFLALDVYYGFGTAPDIDFDHNFYLSMATAL